MKTKKMFFLGLFAAASLLVSCEDKIIGCVHPQTDNCHQNILAKFKMAAYNGEELGCSFYLQAYELNGEEYFVKNSECADMVLSAFDCDGKEYGGSMSGFFDKAVKTKIIGISK